MPDRAILDDKIRRFTMGSAMTFRMGLTSFLITLALLASAEFLQAWTALEERIQRDIALAEQATAAPKQKLVAELLPASAKVWQQLDKLAGPDETLKTIDREMREAMAAMKLINPAQLQTRAQLDDYDRLAQRRAASQRQLDLAVARRRAQVLAHARESEAGRKLIAEFETIEKQIAATYEELDRLSEQALSAKNRLKYYTSPPPPPGKVAGNGEMLVIRPPADAVARAQRFAARNSPEGIAALSREFFARIDLNAKGLEKVGPLLAAGQHAQALDAWRDAFLLRLREPQKHGLPANWGGDLDTASLLRLPVKARLDEAMQGIFSTPRAKAKVGAPGTINWGDPGPDPHADPARNPQLDFYTMRGQMGFVDVVGPHLVLLEGYAATGEKKYLDRWCEVIDDWAMNAPGDMERNPFNIRQYPVLCSFRPVALASTLTDVIDAQPGFAQTMPAPTLARLMLTVMEEYPASFVRKARRGIYNWRCIAMTGSVLTAQVLPEFHIAHWQLDEARKLMELNWSHKILRDGGNLEQGNWGHEPNDQVHLGRAYRLLETQPPVWLDDAWRDEWRDNVKVNARYYLHTLKPDGFSYRFSRVSTSDKFIKRDRFDDPAMPIQTNLLLDEPEARRRLAWIFGEYAIETPQVHSEALPYLGAYMLRGGWEPDASFLYFQSNPNLDCNGREDANGFSYYAYGHALLLAPPLAVDDRTQNIHHGLVADPGGKTIWLTYDHRNQPVQSRFHASKTFDFAEGEYRGVYQLHSGPEAEIFGDYGYTKIAEKLRPQGDEPIRDVHHVRQILSVRGEDVVIITDRFNSEGQRKFSQNYTMFTPVARESWSRRVELKKEENRPPLVIDAKTRSLRTDNGTLPGISVHHFGSAQPSYTLIEDGFAKLGNAQTYDEALATLGSSKLKKWTMGLPLPLSKKVRVDWTTRGPQVIVTALASRPGDFTGQPFSADLQNVEPITGENITGFRATTRRGTKVEYATTTQAVSKLQLGNIMIEGESLLVTANSGQRHGIALGCRQMITDGKQSNAQGDFEFSLLNNNLEITPIHRPIQPVTLLPQATVFTDTVNVELACATPGVEIRYTLDGSDPTVQSLQYRSPITLSATTRIKARAFRAGLSEMPWTSDGTHATAMSWTTYEKKAPFAAVATTSTKPGLAWEYVEGRWAQLLSDVDRLPALKDGSSEAMIDVSMRSTDGAFAVRSSGFIHVPADGVYTFHAPREWQFPDNEPGYDLRLSIHGQDWEPATRRHAHGTWSVALKKGAHPIRIVFIDMRARKFKYELWNNFPNPQIVWKGAVPALEISAPGLGQSAIPEAWLTHQPVDKSARRDTIGR